MRSFARASSSAVVASTTLPSRSTSTGVNASTRDSNGFFFFFFSSGGGGAGGSDSLEASPLKSGSFKSGSLKSPNCSRGAACRAAWAPGCAMPGCSVSAPPMPERKATSAQRIFPDGIIHWDDGSVMVFLLL